MEEPPAEPEETNVANDQRSEFITLTPLSERPVRYLDADGVPTPYINLAASPNPAYAAWAETQDY